MTSRKVTGLSAECRLSDVPPGLKYSSSSGNTIVVYSTAYSHTIPSGHFENCDLDMKSF